MEEKKLYFKVYQDKHNIRSSFVIESDDVVKTTMEAIESWEEELLPVFEPVMMTQNEFKALPEFEGY